MSSVQPAMSDRDVRMAVGVVVPTRSMVGASWSFTRSSEQTSVTMHSHARFASHAIREERRETREERREKTEERREKRDEGRGERRGTREERRETRR